MLRTTLLRSNLPKILCNEIVNSTLFIRTKFTSVTPKNHELARKKLLKEYAKRDLRFNDDWNINSVPDIGIIQQHDEYLRMNEGLEVVEGQEQEEELDLAKLGIVSQIVAIDKVQKPVTQGNILKFRAMVIVGNRNGCAGFAIGKAASVPDAIVRAQRKAYRNMVSLDRFDSRTLYHRVEGKFNSCNVFLQPRPRGSGVVAAPIVDAIMYCFGVSDITSKVRGQRNPFTVVKAVFEAVKQHETAEEIALKTGRRLVDVQAMAKHRKL